MKIYIPIIPVLMMVLLSSFVGAGILWDENYFIITNNGTYHLNYTTNKYNVTLNITNNITNIYNNNFTSNFTNNITIYINTTQNITNTIINNITNYGATTNITNNITNNITTYVTNNITITNNYTYTTNFTNNITTYVTNNVTTYVTNNITINNNFTNNITITINNTYLTNLTPVYASIEHLNTTFKLENISVWSYFTNYYTKNEAYINLSRGATAFSWGNHALAGYGHGSSNLTLAQIVADIGNWTADTAKVNYTIEARAMQNSLVVVNNTAKGLYQNASKWGLYYSNQTAMLTAIARLQVWNRSINTSVEARAFQTSLVSVGNWTADTAKVNYTIEARAMQNSLVVVNNTAKGLYTNASQGQLARWQSLRNNTKAILTELNATNITIRGTICTTSQVLGQNAAGNIICKTNSTSTGGTGNITGKGINGRIPIFTSSTNENTSQFLRWNFTTAKLEVGGFQNYSSGNTNNTNKSTIALTGAGVQTWGYDAGSKMQGQTWNVSVASCLIGMNISMKKGGAPTDNTYITCQNTDGKVPNGILCSATSNITMANSGLTTSFVFYEKNFSTCVPVSRATKYAIAVKRSGALSTLNYMQLASDGGNPYNKGNLTTAGATWASNFANDVLMSLYFRQEINSTITTNSTHYALRVYGIIGADEYLTFTSVYKGKGRAIDKLQNYTYYYNPDGSINHPAFGDTYDTINGGIKLVKEVAYLKQMIYELKTDRDNQKTELEKIKTENIALKDSLMASGLYVEPMLS
jgi:hypothetical protein